ncbi:endo-1,4-beta-xylanase precursor [Ascobolus immersus RN42]|uniref:Beta-xylanase n=1 Tax=Ascobolus immersus RN42 TaxID=1160509 RepID=A0A3N4IDK8_ASCIM|nr:endo-1,4-beta-xylanase precursor [Ascobolus immersus RN42]
MQYRLVLSLAFVTGALAQKAVWEQCGGNGYTGVTTCASGAVCQAYNDWYSQCVPGSASSSSSSSSTKTTSTVSSTTTSVPTPTATGDPGLHALATRKGRYFGIAMDNPALSDQTYLSYAKNTKEFGVVTVGNSLKWDATEPSRNSFSYDRADAIVKFAEANGQAVRGHTLVWHSQLPSWVSNGNFNAAELTRIIESHVTNVMTKFKGRLFHWDVVNEVVDDGGNKLRDSVFSRTLGEEFIAIAFRAARKADPACKLYINDYNIDGLDAKSTFTYDLVKRLLAKGVPIDGVGVQAHLISGSVPGSIQENWARFASLGVDVAITELDIRIPLPVTDAKLQQQKKDYNAVTKACASIPRCVGITIWDFPDHYSWIPSVFPQEGAALPWDSNYKKKPAYYGIQEALQ